jgi:2-polyprenyl-3-methyl-5-hydroxy-6-metoxy-1,4-benzoquinol methylase
MIEISQCPICKGEIFTDTVNCKDFTVSHETFHVKQCQGCQLAITSPRPEDVLLPSYYNSEEYISHSGKTSGGIGSLYKVARKFSLAWKKSLVHKFKSGSTILDFGCGTGEFLSALKQDGWTIDGVEPSPAARLKATHLTGTVIAESLANVSEKKFDIITAWHVLEHVPDIIETIHQLKSALKKDGVIFIAVPNYQSADSVQYKNYWAGYDVPRHLWHFSKKSMTQLLHLQGFKLVEIVPMKLDSYYVSLLSEKYKKGNRITLPSIVKAFSSGFISNLKAGAKTNHSSLIYIARNEE